MTREPFRIRRLPTFDPPEGPATQDGAYPVETGGMRRAGQPPDPANPLAGSRRTAREGSPAPAPAAGRAPSVLDRAVLRSAACVALFVLLLSLAQISGRTVAIPALARLTDGLVGGERLIALQRQAITSAASGGERFTLPGYVVRDVAIPAAAALPDPHGALDEAAARDALLDGSAEQLYARGPGAFVSSGSGVRDAASPIRLLVRALSRTRHREMTALVWVLGAVTGGVLVSAVRRSTDRTRTTALALLLAGAPLLALALMTRVIGGLTAPDGEAGAAYRAVIGSLAGVPARHALALLGGGIVLRVVPLIAQRRGAQDPPRSR